MRDSSRAWSPRATRHDPVRGIQPGRDIQPARGTGRATGQGAAPVLLLPGTQRGGQPRGARRGGPRRPAGTGRGVRDHRGRRRLARPHAGHRRRPGRRSPGHRPGRSPPGQPGLWRRSPIRVRGSALRPGGVHRRRSPVPGRGPACASSTGWRSPTHRTWWWATGSGGPTRSSGRSTRVPIGWRIASSSASRVTDVDCACKLFRREALDGLRVESGGAFFSAELLIKLRAAGRAVVEVGVPHYPRTAGSPTGAKPHGHLPGGPRFLASAPAHVGEPAPGVATGRAHPGRVGLATSGSGSLRQLPRLSASGSTSSEFTKSRKTSSRGSTTARRSSRAGRRALRPRPGRHRPPGPPGQARTAAAKIGAPTRTARARASEGRASTSPIWPSRSRKRRAWNVSSARSEMTTRVDPGVRAPRGRWRTGRG